MGFTAAVQGVEEGKKVEGDRLSSKRRRKRKKLGFLEGEGEMMSFCGICNVDSREP